MKKIRDDQHIWRSELPGPGALLRVGDHTEVDALGGSDDRGLVDPPSAPERAEIVPLEAPGPAPEPRAAPLGAETLLTLDLLARDVAIISAIVKWGLASIALLAVALFFW